ncbi:MAG: hypothetical protein CM1200mP2_51790 [Planctomycetaceae bacterium]|nr:MAG: hypothetical protein CM1200mP2_51790 [Planctomycetaceae bacterium]
MVAGALKMTAYDIKTGKPLWWVKGCQGSSTRLP